MMAKKKREPIWIERIVREHLRLWSCTILGIVTYIALPSDLVGPSRLLLGWDGGVLCYLVATIVVMSRATANEIRRHSEEHDEGAFGILLLTLAATIASFAAIFVELAGTNRGAPGYGLHVALAIGTVILSWAFMHTIFALHYAYQYYGESDRAGGLNFPGDTKPDYWDFVYFAFVIGMTFQVSDVGVSHRIVRRFVVAHGALSFFFTTAIVALTVNLAASVIQQ